MPNVTYLFNKQKTIFGSSVLSWIAYDTESKALYVKVKTGAQEVYRYNHVPGYVYADFSIFSSAGAWWNECVKGQYHSMSLGSYPQFRNTAEEQSDSLDAKYTVVVEFTGPVEFTARGEDVVAVIDSVKNQLDTAGFNGKYKVREVKKV